MLIFNILDLFHNFVTPRYDIFLNFSVRFPFYRYLYQKNVGLAGRHPAPAAFIRHRHRCGRKKCPGSSKPAAKRDSTGRFHPTF